MNKHIGTIALSFLCMTACEQKKEAPVHDTPVISSEGKNIYERLDRTTLQQLPGFTVDFNEDGISDFLTMRDNTLYFSKGIKNGKFDVQIPIVQVQGSVTAYSIRTAAGQRPYFVFFNEKDDGFMQPNLGNNDKGIPYLGDLEALKR